MEDEQANLRAELEAIVRKEWEPTFAHQIERELKNAALSDEEWWESQPTSAQHSILRTKAMNEELKIQRRFERLTFLQGDGPNQIIQTKIDGLLETVMQIRHELNASGPLTEDQYLKARMRKSLLEVTQMSDQIRAAVDKQTNPIRRALIGRFSAMIDQNAEDHKGLSDPNLTEEEFAEITAKINKRWVRFTDSIRPPTE